MDTANGAFCALIMQTTDAAVPSRLRHALMRLPLTTKLEAAALAADVLQTWFQGSCGLRRWLESNISVMIPALVGFFALQIGIDIIKGPCETGPFAVAACNNQTPEDFQFGRNPGQ